MAALSGDQLHMHSHVQARSGVVPLPNACSHKAAPSRTQLVAFSCSSPARAKRSPFQRIVRHQMAACYHPLSSTSSKRAVAQSSHDSVRARRDPALTSLALLSGGNALNSLTPPSRDSWQKEVSWSPLQTARLSNRQPSQDFPEGYEALLLQVKDAVGAALADGVKLLEVEFPTASLDAVPGDAEGGIEMTLSMEMLHEFARMFTASGETKSNARVFFPDATEVKRATEGVFAGSPLRLCSLTEISGFEDLGFSKGVDMQQRTADDDQVFLIAYPYFNVNEMLAVEQLYSSVAEASGVPIVVFNGELDRIRSGYYPGFFYPKLAKLSKTFLPKFEAAFYLHNFKGSRGGRLFRVYPGPWQVLRGAGSSMKCIHTQETMPSLKEVALDILPRA